MQLPLTLLPALFCLLTIAVHHVAGLVVPRGGPGNAIGAKVEVATSISGGGVHRRQTTTATVQAAADTAVKAALDFLVIARRAGSFGGIANFGAVTDAAARVQTITDEAAAAMTFFQIVPKGAVDSEGVATAVALFKLAAERATETVRIFDNAVAAAADEPSNTAATVANLQKAAEAVAAAAATFEAAVNAVAAAAAAAFASASSK